MFCMFPDSKSEWKKVGNWSEFHSERNYYFQNWYFRGSEWYQIHPNWPYRTNLVSNRTFWCPLFPKPVSCPGLFCRFLQQHCSNAIPEKNVPNCLLRDNGSNFHLGRQVLLSPRSLSCFLLWAILCKKIYIFAPFHKAWEGRKNLPLVWNKEILTFFLSHSTRNTLIKMDPNSDLKLGIYFK